MSVNETDDSDRDCGSTSITLVEPEQDIRRDWSDWILGLLQRYSSLDSDEVNAANMPLQEPYGSERYIAPLDAETPDTERFYNLPFRSDERMDLTRFAVPVIETMTGQPVVGQGGYKEIFWSTRPVQLHRAGRILGDYEIEEVYGTRRSVSMGFTYVEHGDGVESAEVETLVDRVERYFSGAENSFETCSYAFQYRGELRPERISATFIGRE